MLAEYAARCQKLLANIGLQQLHSKGMEQSQYWGALHKKPVECPFNPKLQYLLP